MRTRNLVLALSLCLSLAALVALEAFCRRIGATIDRDSRNFLAADFRIQAWRVFDDKVLQGVKEEAARGDVAFRTDFVSTAELPGGDTQTVSVAAVRGEYPFYGSWRTDPQMKTQELGGAEPLLIADNSLRARGLKVGDSVRLGAVTFRLAAFLLEEPQTVASAFASGPRIVIHDNWAQKTALLGVGSRAFRQLLVRSPLAAKDFQKKFRASAPDPHWRLITPERANRQAASILTRMRGFLSFVLLCGLFLGGSGVFMIFRSRFLAELPSFLTYRCLGMKSRPLLMRSLREALGISLLSWIPASILGLLLERMVTAYARTKLDVTLSTEQPIEPVFLALLVTLILVGMSVLVPLQEILRVPVQMAFRQSEARTRGFSARDGFVLGGVSILLTLLIARSWKLAAVFVVGLAITVVFLLVVSWLLMQLWVRLPFVRSFVFRQAALSFARQPASSLLLVVTTGVGVFFLSSILFLGHSLRKQIDFSNRLGVPNLFMMGVAEADKDKLAGMIPSPSFVPVIQARLTELKGAPVEESAEPKEQDDQEMEHFYRTREYVITKRANTSEGERILLGDSLFGAPAALGVVRISLEKNFASDIGLKVGDSLKIEIAGVSLAGEVRSLRKVDWFNLRPNFFIVVDEDDVAGAPFSFVALTRVPVEKIPEYQRAITRAFPAVTALDGESIARRLLKLLDQLSLSVYSVGVFALGSCAFVFAGILLSRRMPKLQELALFKCLGVTTPKLHALLAWEFFAAGMVAASTALVSALLTTAAVCRFFLDVPMEFPPLAYTLGILIGLPLLSSLGGWLMMRGLLQQSSMTLFRVAEDI